MTDRPSNCRNALQAAGKPYPRSGCAVCKTGGLMGCPYERGEASKPEAVAPSTAGNDNLTEFTEWLAREMPPGTVISDPRWWAPRIAARFIERHIAGQQGATNPAADAIQYHNAVGPIEAMSAVFSAMDNSDTALGEWPQRAIDALAFAGWAVVPYVLPYEVLGEAGISGVFETGNPKHGWDWLVAKTRIGPHGPPIATPKPATYDRELIAKMLDEYKVCTHWKYTAPAIEEQVRLLRAAKGKHQ